jgi:histidinol-phosphate aminotransferase
MSPSPVNNPRFGDWVRPELRGLKPYASARSIAPDEPTPIGLDANENPWPVEADNPLNRYPDPQPKALVLALAEHYGVAPETLLVTRGSDEGIDLLMRLFCRPNEDRVMVHSPCFGMYALYAQIQGAAVVDVPLIAGKSDWAVNWLQIEQAPPCRLVFFCSPNNPTGHCVDSVSLLTYAKQVEDQSLVVVDEAYIEFCEQDSMASLVMRQPNLVILRTLSKAFGLAGARLGSVIAHPELIGWLKRIIAPYPLPTPSVEAALTALTSDALEKQERQLALLAINKERVVDYLSNHPAVVTVWPGQANFVLVRVDDATEWMSHLAQSGIRVRNQSHQAKLDNCLRITVGDEQQTQALIECLERYTPTSAVATG